jgi:hypothetical protein
VVWLWWIGGSVTEWVTGGFTGGRSGFFQKDEIYFSPRALF